MRRGPAIVLLFCLLFGAAYGAYRAGQEGLDRLAHFAPSHLAAESTTAGSTPLTNRVLFIIVDGLRFEEVHLLPSLEWLRGQGASFQLLADGASSPTLADTTLLTGAPATLNGLFWPDSNPVLQADHFLRSAQRNKITTGGAGSPELGHLIAGTIATWYEGRSMEELQGGISALLKPDGPRLVFCQVPDLLARIRLTRAADPANADYRDALAAMDADLVRILDLVDWKTTTVVVTGNLPLDRNGDFAAQGSIPLIMAGTAVRPGLRSNGTLLDVAPTVSALLGLPAPLQAQGRPLLDGLQVEGRPADAIMQSYLGVRRTFTDLALQAYGSAATAPEPPASTVDADAYLTKLSSAVTDAESQWRRDAIMQWLPYVGPGLLLLLIYLVIVWRQPFGRAALLSAIVYGIAFQVFFFLSGGRYSNALHGLDSPLPDLRLRLGLVAGAAMGLTAIVTGLLLSRREFKRPSYLTTSALHINLSLAALVSIPAGGAALLVGWEFPVALPATGLWVWFFTSVLQVLVIGGASPVWSLLTVQSARLGQYLWPLPEVGDPEANADKVVRLRAIKRSRNHSARG